MHSPGWQQIRDGVFSLQDSCRVYAIRGPEGTILINAGTGLAAESLGDVAPDGRMTVLLTHHSRDHTDGAIRLHAAGATIMGPYWDQEYLLDPDQHFRERQIWNSYDNRWERFSPVRPLPVTDWMMDYETRQIAGLDVEVVPTPGVTNGANIYLVTLGGRKLAFVGEVICGHGRTGRLAPLQYNYNDMTGAVNLWHSCSRLLAAGPDVLLPSLGEPMEDPAGAIAAFKANIERLKTFVRDPNPSLHTLGEDEGDDLEEILPHLYRSTRASACTAWQGSRNASVSIASTPYWSRTSTTTT